MNLSRRSALTLLASVPFVGRLLREVKTGPVAPTPQADHLNAALRLPATTAWVPRRHGMSRGVYVFDGTGVYLNGRRVEFSALRESARPCFALDECADIDPEHLRSVVMPLLSPTPERAHRSSRSS